MWDKHQRFRKDSRKRAVRAAQARAARRSGGGSGEAAPPPDPEPAPNAPEPDVSPPDAAPEPETAPASEPAPRDAAGSLAWTGLVLLTLILGGFIGAVFFMLG